MPVRLTLEEAARGTERELQLDGRPFTRAHPAGRDRRPAPAAARQGRCRREWRAGGRPVPADRAAAASALPARAATISRSMCRSRRGKRRSAPQVEVPTLEGRVTMKVPPGSKGGQKLRLAGKGRQAGRRRGRPLRELEDRRAGHAHRAREKTLRRAARRFTLQPALALRRLSDARGDRARDGGAGRALSRHHGMPRRPRVDRRKCVERARRGAPAAAPADRQRDRRR